MDKTIMNKKYTIRQAIDFASRFTYRGRLADIMGYASKTYWKNHLGSYDKGRKKEFIVTKRKFGGKSYIVITNIKDEHDYLWYRAS